VVGWEPQATTCFETQYITNRLETHESSIPSSERADRLLKQSQLNKLFMIEQYQMAHIVGAEEVR